MNLCLMFLLSCQLSYCISDDFIVMDKLEYQNNLMPFNVLFLKHTHFIFALKCYPFFLSLVFFGSQKDTVNE